MRGPLPEALRMPKRCAHLGSKLKPKWSWMLMMRTMKTNMMLDEDDDYDDDEGLMMIDNDDVV